jgi:hypothetical protein
MPQLIQRMLNVTKRLKKRSVKQGAAVSKPPKLEDGRLETAPPCYSIRFAMSLS